MTLLAFGLFGLTVAAFCVAGPVAGLVFSIPVWVVVFYFAVRREPSDLAGIRRRPEEFRHRVLVVADHGLARPGLIDELTRRAELGRAEVMIVAPVVASSTLTP